MRALACLALSLVMVGSASARARAPGASKAPVAKPVAEPVAEPAGKPVATVPEPGPVHGRVVTPWGLGIARRWVSLGKERTLTDGEGRFTFEDVPVTYDITITERDHREATAYHGLTRRDPVLAHRPARTITQGFKADGSLALLAAGTGRIAGTVELFKPKFPPRRGILTRAESLTFSYLQPDHGSAVDLGSCKTDGAYDCELPDLTSLGGEYCMAIGESVWKLRAMRCGGKIGMKEFSIPAQSPAPQITVDGGHGDGMVSWTCPGDTDVHVYALNLGYDFEGLDVQVYTSERSFTWSQVAALGVDFSYGHTRLRGITVTALLPYVSMDDLASGRGPMAMGTSWRKVESNEVELPLPASFKVAIPARPGKFEPGNLQNVPACPSPDAVKSVGVGEIRPSIVNTRVTLRGPLAFDAWECTSTELGCGCAAHWLVVDARSPGTGVLLQRAEGIAPLSTDAGCDGPKPTPPRIEVMATGLLVARPDDPRLAGRTRYILDNVRVCAVVPVGKP
jgi:hypothetical protein